MKKSKILEISSFPPPRAGWGIRVGYVKAALIEAGHKCKVLNTSPFSRKIPSTEYMRTLNGLDYFLKILVHRFAGYRVHMHLNGDSPKGFILTSIAVIASLLTLHRPYLTFHAGPYQKYFPNERAPKLRMFYKFVFSSAKIIICNDDNVKAKILEYGTRDNKVKPIKSFSKQYLQYKEVSIPEKLKNFMNSKKFIICSYVFYRPEFFVEDMIRAMPLIFKSLPDAGLLMMGDDSGASKIKPLISELNLEKNIFFTGDLNHDHFLSVMAASDIYLRTPVKDGVSSSVLEALSLGVPVVASENDRRPDSVVVYDHTNIEDMAEKTIMVLQNLEKFRKNIVTPEIEDTVKIEVELLTGE